MTQSGAVGQSTSVPGYAAVARAGAAAHLHVFVRRLARNRVALVGGLVFLAVAVSAAAAPLLAPSAPDTQDFSAMLAPPGPGHLFGTDEQGRDLLSRVLYGGRVSLRIGVVAVCIAAGVGIVLGLLAGYYPGWSDTLIMRWMDVMLAFPSMLLALAVVSMLGTGVTPLMIAVGISSIPQYTRVARGSVLTAKEADYVAAARVVGCSTGRILVRHILPNVFAPLMVLITTGMASAIITGAALSFLGLGAQPPTAEWGNMLSNGRVYLEPAPWMMIFPGIAIFISVMAINLFGDGLRDTLDPRLK
jgi:peptide/nickel transport system permease protein